MRLFASVVFVVLLCCSRAHAQSTGDVVRGRVTDDSTHAVGGAVVIITRGPDRLVQQTTTDSSGRFTSRFENGTGDYLVTVTAAGLKSARRRVQRAQSERELVADFVLSRDLTTLAAVKVKAEKPVRASSAATPYTKETGASESWSDGVNGQVAPGQLGDLSAIAGTIAGVTITGSGPSMLGAATSSNLTTLNGMALAGGSVPRAARTDTRVTGATFDPTRGGFSGANIDVRLAAGSRDYQRRNGYLTLDAPQLQATDAIGRSLGVVNGGFRGSVGADGELIRQTLVYNVALDVSRTTSDPATLLNAGNDIWQRAGVSPDSVRRALQLASTARIPVSVAGAPISRQRDGISWLGRFDDIRDSLRALTLTTYLSSSNQGAIGFAPLTAPAASGRAEDRTMGVQLMHSEFVGAGHLVLLQNKLSFSRSAQTSRPYSLLPGATVLVRSSSDAATSDVASLSLGGAPWIATDDRRWTAEASNLVGWNARGAKHRFKIFVWARADGLQQSGLPNAAGTYAFASLADLASNRPSSYSRTITQPVRSAEAYNAALAFAHQWSPSRWLSVLYGAGVEANAFGTAPAVNPALNAALPVQSGVAPSRIHVSPRLGFSYTYSRDKDNGNGMSSNQLGTFYRSVMGFVRGGIGEFRDLYAPNMLTDAIAGSGLAGSTLSLTCVGAAVPLPDWNSLEANPSALPTSCAGGASGLAERAPSVTLLDRSFDAPRSWRASLGWASNIGTWTVKVDGLGSYDLAQPSTLDANFSGVRRFVLRNEMNRDVFVMPSSIDATTGTLSAADARIAPAFGRVAVRTSDLRAYGGQLTTTIAPDVFRFKSRLRLFVAGSYTLQRLQQQYRGFDGANFGDPRATAWSVGSGEARHAVVLQAGISLPWVGTVTVFSRAQSGLPFTPLVQGDINGDGRANDRAFVPNLAAGGDASLSAQMRALLAASPSNVRDCLERQLGTVAGRNSCRGAWTPSLNVQWQQVLPIKVQGREIQTSFVFQNPLAGIDQLVHGASKLRGWGTRAAPDPILLVPRSFDASAQQFRYDVNPRFGDTRASRTLSREPFRITLDVSVNFSTPYDIQQLRRAIEPVRSSGGWARRSVDSLMAFYLQRTSNLHRLVLSESDSLFLSREQIAQLLVADSVYSERVRAVYRPLAEYLAGVPSGGAGKAALDTASATDKAYWRVFWEQVDIVRPLVTAQQRALVPLLKNISEVTDEERKQAHWFFGNAVPVTHNKPRVGGS